MSDEQQQAKMEIPGDEPEAPEEAVEAEVVDGPNLYRVVSLGWGVVTGDVVIHTGSKGECIKQARAEAKENKAPAEVEVQLKGGNIVRREYY